MIKRFHFEAALRLNPPEPRPSEQFNPVLGGNFEMIKRFHFEVKCGVLGP